MDPALVRRRISQLKESFEGKSLEMHPSLASVIAPPKAGNPYLSSAALRQPKRKARPVLVEAGRFSSEAEALRKKHKLALLQRQVEEKAFAKGLSTRLLSDFTQRTAPVAAEWWDLPFLPNACYPETSEEVCLDFVTSLILKPSLVTALPAAETAAKPAPPMLTKAEQRKQRKLARSLRIKEHQDQVRLGLAPPDPPKVRLANLAQVLASSSDPTKAEQEIHQASQKRREQHDLANAQRRLTPAELSRKRKNHFTEDVAGRVYILIVEVCGPEISPQNLFKLGVNARQNHLTGRIYLVEECEAKVRAVIVAEGGPKGVRRYRHLVLDRISWGCATAGLRWEGCRTQPIVGGGSFEQQAVPNFFELSKIIHTLGIDSVGSHP